MYAKFWPFGTVLDRYGIKHVVTVHIILEHESIIVYAVFLFFDICFYLGYERLVALIVGWIAATGPAHRDALLFIGSRNLKIVIRNAHLFEASLWFACAHVALFQEMIIWSNQIFAEVEIIVVHPCWKDQAAWASAVVVEVFRVLERNERIFHAVHQKTWGSRHCKSSRYSWIYPI